MNFSTLSRLPILLLAVPAGLVYGAAIFIRNALYDLRILCSVKFDVPVICVGNIAVGGTGKTPHIEYLIHKYRNERNIAVVSRGYKRKSAGFGYIEITDDADRAGDEPLQIKLKFPDIIVAVDVKRERAIEKILSDYPDTSLILLDDAYQYRKVTAERNIVLTDYNCPIWRDMLLPVGMLRDFKRRLRRADAVIVTKCPEGIDYSEKSEIIRKLKLKPETPVYFSSFVYKAPTPVFADRRTSLPPNPETLAMAGVSNPETFFAETERNFGIRAKLIYGDHHRFGESDIAAIQEKSKTCDLILTTEKDAVRLRMCADKIADSVKRKMYYLPVEVVISGNTFNPNSFLSE